MSNHATDYMQYLVGKICAVIDAELSDQRTPLVATKAIAFHFTDEKSLAFQKYYVEIVGNEEFFLSSNGFFSRFKTKYSLQGIDGDHLGRLEKAKTDILCDLKNDSLTRLYLAHFAQVPIRHGDGSRLKDLGSFFSKLTHTFRSSDYCALDNPIKKHFGLANEGFYMSFISISSAYRSWIQENPQRVSVLREQVNTHPIAKDYAHKMTDLKLLDLVFWLRANKPQILPGLG